MLKKTVKNVALAIAFLSLGTGCSKAPVAADKEAKVVEKHAAALPASSAAEKSASEVSKIISKADVTVRGKSGCRIDFVYAGFEPEDLFWEGESCEKVRAKLVDQPELLKLSKWQRLEDFEQRDVAELPGGKVLYVEGQFTASVYPVDVTRLSYEVSVAD